MRIDRTDLKPFRRDAMFLVEQVRKMARERGWRCVWQRAAQKLALEYGEFVVWRCDDTVIVYTATDGKVSHRSYKPTTWRFA